MASVSSLPSQITNQIIGFLDGKTQLNLRRVSKAFKEAIPLNQVPLIPQQPVVKLRNLLNELYIFVITLEYSTIFLLFFVAVASVLVYLK